MELIILDKADNDLLNIPNKEATKILNKINLACKGNKSNIKNLTNNDPEY